jgi:antitoxin (DNA-binding transcriptional repressor) of toxin-antitoxin stability system
MIEGMEVHISGADAARQFLALLEKVRHGAEVIIEEDERPIAVLRAAPCSGRPISECITLAKARGSNATMDEDFARDVEEAIRIHNEPWKPPSSD